MLQSISQSYRKCKPEKCLNKIEVGKKDLNCIVSLDNWRIHTGFRISMDPHVCF